MPKTKSFSFPLHVAETFDFDVKHPSQAILSKEEWNAVFDAIHNDAYTLTKEAIARGLKPHHPHNPHRLGSLEFDAFESGRDAARGEEKT